MTVNYDKYYQTENLFGNAYPELLAFFDACPTKGKVLDVGCGQGRDSIPIAQLGYSVTGIDHSKVGIEQMIANAKAQNVAIEGIVGDIFTFNQFDKYDFILLDSMFHFAKKDRSKELEFIKRIVSEMKIGVFLVVCIQDKKYKVQSFYKGLEGIDAYNQLVDQ